MLFSGAGTVFGSGGGSGAGGAVMGFGADGGVGIAVDWIGADGFCWGMGNFAISCFLKSIKFFNSGCCWGIAVDSLGISGKALRRSIGPGADVMRREVVFS